MSITPPPPLPPARSSTIQQHQVPNQQNKLVSNSQVSGSKRSENYYITSSLISRVSSKDQLSTSDSVNNLTRIGQAARMKRCMSSVSPLSSASNCSTTSSNDMVVQDVHVDVHPVPDDMMNRVSYTEIDHDKDDDKEIKKISTYLSQSQTSLSGSSSFFMDDDNWYSELIMNNLKPIKIIPSNNQQTKYNNSKYGNNQVKRSSTFNSDDGCDGNSGGVPSTTSSTDSPGSDSGITDQLLETMLREKDSEIALLRETLEQNEQVTKFN